MEKGDKVLESPVGPGVVTNYSLNGYIGVDDQPTSWAIIETKDGKKELFDPKHIYRDESETQKQEAARMEHDEHILKPTIPASLDEATTFAAKEHRFLVDKTNFAMMIAAGLRSGKKLAEIDAALSLYRRRTGVEMTKKMPKAEVQQTLPNSSPPKDSTTKKAKDDG